MRLIDGRAIAAAINKDTAAAVATLPVAEGTPTLAVLVPTADEGTAWYVRSIEKAAARLGIACKTNTVHDATPDRIRSILDAWSADPDIHGIICQTPLPDGITLAEAGSNIDLAKDVDGANPASLGRLAAGLSAFAPATAAAVAEILHRENVQLQGAPVVVVGRSNVVGKPAALLLLADHATVTIAHSRTRDLAAVCRTADVLVAAVGRTHLIGSRHIKPGAVVIDVGTNPTGDGGLAGDVDPDGTEHAEAVTPVPGGVGPVTTAMLLAHTVQAAQGRVGLSVKFTNSQFT